MALRPQPLGPEHLQVRRDALLGGPFVVEAGVGHVSLHNQGGQAQFLLQRLFEARLGEGEGLAAPVGMHHHAVDGKAARLIFLLLTPKHDQGAQVQMLANIARIFHDPQARNAAVEAKNFNEIKNILDKD